MTLQLPFSGIVHDGKNGQYVEPQELQANQDAFAQTFPVGPENLTDSVPALTGTLQKLQIAGPYTFAPASPMVAGTIYSSGTFTIPGAASGPIVPVGVWDALGGAANDVVWEVVLLSSTTFRIDYRSVGGLGAPLFNWQGFALYIAA